MANTSDEGLDVRELLEKLASHEPGGAWNDFLESFSPLIFRIVKLVEQDPDHASDCFLFICERLSEKHFQRLRRYRFNSGAKFSTWLWVVVRNLCRDWHRKEFGRERVSRSIARLSPIDQAVYRSVFEQGLPVEAAFASLKQQGHPLTREDVEESVNRIQSALSPRQLWLLRAQKVQIVPMEPGEESGGASPINHIPDLAPNPEAALVQKERFESLGAAFRNLSDTDRLMVVLRYERNLTMQEIAKLLGLKDLWAVDRRLKEILGELRKRVDP